MDTENEGVDLQFTNNTNVSGSDGGNKRVSEANIPSKTTGSDQSEIDLTVDHQSEYTKDGDGQYPTATIVTSEILQPESSQSQPLPLQPEPPQPPPGQQLQTHQPQPQKPQTHQPQPQQTQLQQPTVQTMMNKVSPTTTVSKKMPTDKFVVKRSKSNVDNRMSMDRSNTSKAIVEVLDRVDTPQLSSASATVGSSDNGDNGNKNTDENAGRPIAFSVLPTGGQDDDKACECPNCRKKPLQSTSSKCFIYKK